MSRAFLAAAVAAALVGDALLDGTVRAVLLACAIGAGVFLGRRAA